MLRASRGGLLACVLVGAACTYGEYDGLVSPRDGVETADASILPNPDGRPGGQSGAGGGNGPSAGSGPEAAGGTASAGGTAEAGSAGTTVGAGDAGGSGPVDPLRCADEAGRPYSDAGCGGGERPCSSNADCADNGRYCDGAEVCAQGACISEGNPCGDQVCLESCNEETACDGEGRCVACLRDADCGSEAPYCDGSGQCVECLAAEDCSESGNVCLQTACNAGQCGLAPTPGGVPCGDEATACSDVDRCDNAGNCAPNHAPAGEELPPDGCVLRECDGTGGIRSTPSNAGCNRSETECSAPDTCNADGSCSPNDSPSGTVLDPVGCLLRECDGAGGIRSTPSNARCDRASTECSAPDTCNADGTCNPNHLPNGRQLARRGECLDRACDGLGGVAEFRNDAACDDGLFCTGTETCQSSGQCSSSGDPCPGADGDADCSESCNESADSCTRNDPSGSSCNDGLSCTRGDSCNSSGSCVGTGACGQYRCDEDRCFESCRNGNAPFCGGGDSECCGRSCFSSCE